MLPIPKCLEYRESEFYQEWWKAICQSSGLFYKYNEVTCSYQDAARIVLKWVDVFNGQTQKGVVTLTSKIPEAYATIWALVLSNQVWTPASPELPWNRIKKVLEAAKPERIVLDRPGQLIQVESWANENGVSVNYLSDFEVAKNDEVTVLNSTSRPLDSWVPPARSASDVCYLLFTSGSTGSPKGVPITHSNLLPFLRNMFRVLDLNSSDVFADFHDWAFDISIFYLFCAPLCGGTIVPARTPSEKQFPMEHVRKNAVTVWATVPSTMNKLQALRPESSWTHSLKILFICGEVFTLKTMEYIQKYINPKYLFNFYGLTETAVENFYHPCMPDDSKTYSKYGIVPIGKPLPENEFKIDSEGVLWISSAQVFDGYLDNQHKDRWKVVDHKSWFCTGDLVELHADNVVVRGRADHQVKLNGYRVELGDIEVQLEKIAQVRRAVCVLLPGAGGLIKLAAAILVETIQAPCGDHETHHETRVLGPKASGVMNDLKSFSSFLRTELKQVLPEYMVPREYYFFDDFPLNSSGKIDRGTLLNWVSQKEGAKN